MDAEETGANLKRAALGRDGPDLLDVPAMSSTTDRQSVKNIYGQTTGDGRDWLRGYRSASTPTLTPGRRGRGLVVAGEPGGFSESLPRYMLEEAAVSSSRVSPFMSRSTG